jgi:hypothetical protein
LTNADEAISLWSRCFSLRWRLNDVSIISCFREFCWSFLYNQLFFSSLEAIRSTYFECITLLSLRGGIASRGRLWHTLEKALASPSNSRIMQLHSSFQALWQGDSSVSTYMQQAKSLFVWFMMAFFLIPYKSQNQ